MTGEDWAGGIELDRPSAARMYDYFLGGSHNFAVDREAADQVVQALPNVRLLAAANRAFLRDAVLGLLDLGIRQFLDIGSGIPTVGNVHEIAQATDPSARVVYVDIDQAAIAHARRILDGNESATAVAEDLRRPEAILDHPEVRALLDLDRPVGLLLVSMLHFLPDSDAYPAVAYLRDALPEGSALAITHGTLDAVTRPVRPEDYETVAAVYERSTARGGAPRTRAQIARFFDGYDMIEPGLVWVSHWRRSAFPEQDERPEHDELREQDERPEQDECPEHLGMLAGVARKPG